MALKSSTPQTVTVADQSPYVNTNLYRGSDDKLFFGPWHRLVLENDITDIFHTVGSGEVGALDLIAFNYYGQEGLWWLLADFNSITDQFSEMSVGMVLRIPTKQRVMQLFAG
jgi:hypothetical protein